MIYELFKIKNIRVITVYSPPWSLNEASLMIKYLYFKLVIPFRDKFAQKISPWKIFDTFQNLTFG